MRVTLADYTPAMRAVLLSLAGLVGVHLVAGAFSLAKLPYVGFASRGDVVAAVDPGSPAEIAGLKVGDRILQVYVANESGSSLPARQVAPDRLRSLDRGTRVGVIVKRGAAAGSVFFDLPAPPPSEAVRRILSLLTAFTFLGVGAFTFLRRPDALGRTFLFLCLAFALFFRQALPPNPPLLGKLESLVDDLGVLLLGASLIHFVLLFPPGRRPGRWRRPALIAVYGAAGLLALESTVFTLGPGPPPAIAAALGVPAVLYVGGCILAALAIFVRNVRRAREPSQALRLRVVLWGTVLGLAPMTAFLLLRNLVPGGGIPGDQYAVLAVWILPLSYMYAIIRHQIFDIRIMVRRGVIYFLLTTCLALVYFGVVMLLGPWLDPREGHPGVAALSLLLIALIFTSTRGGIQSVVDRVFFRADAGRRRQLQALSRRVGDMVDSERFENSIFEELSRLLDAERAALFLAADGGRRLTLAGFMNGKDPASEPDEFPFPPALCTLLDRMPGPMTRAVLLESAPEDQRAAMAARLQELGFDIFLPLRDGEALHALVALALPQRTGGPDSEELALLTHISEDASAALTQALRHDDEIERERIAGELAVAREIQQHLLPLEPPLSPLVELSGITLPCDAVGGDCHDYVQLPDGRVGFAVADVSGKGVPAAILMASIQASFRASAELGQTPGPLLQMLNRRVLDIGESDKFVCFFYGLIDPVTMEMRYSNAGMDPPLWIRRDGLAIDLERGGPVLGVLPGVEYEEGVIHLESGDVIACFSDGLVDARRAEEAPLERDTIRRLLLENPGAGADALRRLLLRAGGLSPQARAPDDVTLLLARIY